MSPVSSVSWGFLRHQSKLFWTLFIVFGLLIIFGILGVFYLDILFGFLIVIIGIEKLRDEIYAHVNEKDKQTVYDSINYINNWMNSSIDMTTMLNDKYDNRFFRLDTRQKKLDKTLEMKHRELVRKIVEIENKLNDVNKILRVLTGTEEKVRRKKAKK